MARSRDFFSSSGKPDYFFIGLVCALVSFGLLMLSSVSVVVSFQKFGTSYYYPFHQILFGLLPGLVLFILFLRLDYRILKEGALFFLLLSLALLALVFFPGIGLEHGGARRWIHAGFFSFQPSEVVKLSFVLYLAAWFVKQGGKGIKDFSTGFLPFIVLLGSVALLIIAQPDIGTMSVIAASALIMYIAAGARLYHFFLLCGGAAGLFFLLIKTAPYRLSRFTTFLHPELDPLGIGYHINQALLAVGSGGLWGRGFGHSRQKFAYLPEVTGDSIFAIIAEELGFVLLLFFITVLVFFLVRGFHIARRTEDPFGKLLVVGIMGWVSFQTFINIGAMLSLVPLTGIPLPFISYGGSALVVLMAAMGIVANISRNNRR